MTTTDDDDGVTVGDARAWDDCACGHYWIDHSPVTDACVLCDCEQFIGTRVDD